MGKLRVIEMRYPYEDGEYSPEDEPYDDETFEDITAEEAASIIIDQGCTEPSSVPGFYPGMWYSSPDGPYLSMLGEYQEITCHPDGFTVGEQRVIWFKVTSA